jgi:MFS family permease
MNKRTKGNIVVGAIVSFVFAAYAGGPLIGGAVAGYLEGSDLRWGIRVGAMAGIVVLIASFVLTIENILLGTETYYGLRPLFYGTLTRGIVPYVVLPLVGGGIGAYVRRETGE